MHLVATPRPQGCPRDRERRIEKLRSRMNKSQQLASHSYRSTVRFLDFSDGKVRLNEDKIAQAARWDGLRGIVAWGLRPDRPA